MCSIFGIIGEIDEVKAKYALNKLSHRGRDNCGIIHKENIFFAHHLLSIQDTSKNAYQPFQYKNILLSFNGEIYNFKELRNELKNEYDFKSSCDTEVILASYLKWGIDFVHHFRGMFAIALLDANILYLFRDRLGKKPLFYFEGKEFVFASEIKALTPFLTHTQMNKDALLSYLSFLAPSPPHTFFKGINKLAAGEYLKYDINTKIVKVQRYYDILDASPNIIYSRDEAIYSLEKLLKESIEIRLNADVPMASLLSGGIDSATINAYAVKLGKNLPSYTVGYDGYKKYDERAKAKETADFLGLNHTEIIISKDKFLDASDIVLDALDEPLNDPAAIPLYLLFKKIAKDGYKVVLSGEGSDEIFLGYKQYFEYLDIEKARDLKHKNWLKNYFKSNYSANREWEHYNRIFNDTLLFRTSGESFSDLQKNFLMKQNIKNNQALKYLQTYRQRFNASKHKDESIWYSYIDLNLFQAEHYLTKLDRMSMLNTIEARTPFLDHKLISKIFNIAPHLRYEDGQTKSLLKSIVKPLLNEKIIQNKKKGFSNPYMEYLLSSNKLLLIQEVNKKTKLFKDNELQDYLIYASKGHFKQHTWGLYVLSVWIKKHLL